MALHSVTSKEHICHHGMECAWGTELERDIVEAIVKLLKETSANLEGSLNCPLIFSTHFPSANFQVSFSSSQLFQLSPRVLNFISFDREYDLITFKFY